MESHLHFKGKLNQIFKESSYLSGVAFKYSVIVLVCLGCQNKVWTGRLINKPFSQLEKQVQARSRRLRYQLSSHCNVTWQKSRGSPWGLLQDTDPIQESFAFMTYSSLKCPPPNTITMGDRFQQKILGRGCGREAQTCRP